MLGGVPSKYLVPHSLSQKPIVSFIELIKFIIFLFIFFCLNFQAECSTQVETIICLSQLMVNP